jgi:phenylacetate-CoA ligase
MLPALYPPLVRNVIYPAYRGLRGDRLVSHLEELERNQWLTRDEIEDIRWRRVEQYLREITVHVPYYRELFEREGLAVDAIQGPGDFRRIPFLTKDDIRAAKDRIVTKDPMRRGVSSNTGGSTGEPL